MLCTTRDGPVTTVYYDPRDPPHRHSELDRQAIELFSEEAPDVRDASHATIAEAIAAHDAAFS